MELSIVLVILGLLVGGVLSGQALIHAAELRAITTEYNQYRTALGTFKDKYQALPGDMPNAVSFWGAADGGLADGLDTDCVSHSLNSIPSTDQSTCNGNGDGKIIEKIEWYRAWQHLANAGLIPDTLSGVGLAPDLGTEPGVNIPLSKYRQAGWTLVDSVPVVTQYAGIYDGMPDCSIHNIGCPDFGTLLIFGLGQSDTESMNPVIKAEDTYNLDRKLDDGAPHKGSLRIYDHGYLPDCINADNDAYQLDNPTYGCSFAIRTGF